MPALLVLLIDITLVPGFPRTDDSASFVAVFPCGPEGADTCALWELTGNWVEILGVSASSVSPWITDHLMAMKDPCILIIPMLLDLARRHQP